MDPNETLTKIRELATKIGQFDFDHPEQLYGTAADLAEHVEALDEWLSKGGFPPDAWGRPETDDEYALRIVTAEPLGGPIPGVAGSHLPEGEH